MTAKKIRRPVVPLKKAASTKSPILKATVVKSSAKPIVKPRATRPPISKVVKDLGSSAEKGKPNAHVREFKFPVDKRVPFDPKKIDPEVFRRSANAPDHIEYSVEPAEGDNVFFHPTPGLTSKEKPMGLLAIRVDIFNKGTEIIELEKLVLECKEGNSIIKKDVYLFDGKIIIDPGADKYWQNSRNYGDEGEVVSLVFPFPNKVKVSLYFKNYKDPLSVTKNLIPYPHALPLPFDKADFGEGEYISGASTHSTSGGQVFANDLGVVAYNGEKWSNLLPNKDDSENEHFRLYGKPVRAMADGTVLHFENDMPNNPKPGNSQAEQKILGKGFPYWYFGNYFSIRHGDVVALYAHFQKGSLNSSLMEKGAIVKKGDELGKAGNSGNSGGPHLHIHLTAYGPPSNGAYRSLLFNEGYVIGKEYYKTPKSNVNWSKLRNQGIPGVGGQGCLVAFEHPYCEYPTTWGEVARYGIDEAHYQTEFDKIWTCGYYPVWINGFDVNGKTYFNAIFRASKNVTWVARHNLDGTKYQAEFDKWGKAGYRLININSYLLKGKLRYAAVWKKDNSVNWMAYHGQTLAWHETNFEKHFKAGWIPVNVSCTHVGSKTYVAALWEKKNTGGFYLRTDIDLKAFNDAFNDYTNDKKFKLVYIDASTKAGKPRLTGIWYKNAPDSNSWYELHQFSSSQFQAEYTKALKNGFLTRCIVGYEDGRKTKYGAIWSKK